MAQYFEFANNLYFGYENYREHSLTHRRFKYSDITPLIEQLKNKNFFEVNKAGQSAKGRDIYLISAGHGPIKIFLWSQMHGDESTATMALFDIFNFLSSNDGFNDFRKHILQKLTLYFMPMVNPDGAEIFQRRNIFDIDLNRDAARLQTPEAKILRKTFEKLKVNFGFNLHDQLTYYTSGNSFKSATLSFLAPVFNYEKTVTVAREEAIKLIGQLFRVLSNFIPGHIAKYTDEYEPRAFGDTFQGLGTSIVLIESGGWKDDYEKQFIRKLNFIALLTAFKSIAGGEYLKESSQVYNAIPFNEKNLMDVILRNVKTKKDGHDYLIDIGILHNEINIENTEDFYYMSTVEDLGDLSVYFGYNDYDLTGYEVEPGKIYTKTFHSVEEIKGLDFHNLYNKGFTSVKLNDDNFKEKFTKLPVNIIMTKQPNDSDEIKLSVRPDYVLKKNGKTIYVVINGFLYNITNKTGNIVNGLVIR